MPSKNERNIMICSAICIIVCAIVIPVVVTQVGKDKPRQKEWEIIGEPLWYDHGGIANGNIAMSESGKRLLLVEFNRSSVGVFDWHPKEETNDLYVEQEASSQIPAPVLTQSNAFRQVASMSGDGQTIAIGYPEEGMDGTTAVAGYVATYTFSKEDQTWSPQGNLLSFQNVMDSTKLYTEGHFGAATALSQDGKRLAIGITQVHGLNEPNNANSVFHTSYVQVMEFQNDEWTKLGPLIEGICLEGNNNLGCLPCQGSFGTGEIDFGTTLSFNQAGSRLAVGAPQAIGGCDAERAKTGGFVRVYQIQQDEEWVQMGKDIVQLQFNDADHNFAPREFGLSLSLAGERLAIGSNAGAVIVYWKEEETDWKLNHDFKWSTKNTFENLKSQVSLTADGNKFAFSGPESESHGGQVKTYEWVKDEKWNHYGATLRGNTGFGASIALSATNGTILAVKGGFDTTVYEEP